MDTYICLYREVCLSSRGVLVRGFLSGKFCSGVVLSAPPSVRNSEYICYNRKLNITFNFRFHMYEKNLKCDATCSWTPSVTNCHTFSDPLPSSVTYFMDRSKVVTNRLTFYELLLDQKTMIAFN